MWSELCVLLCESVGNYSILRASLSVPLIVVYLYCGMYRGVSIFLMSDFVYRNGQRWHLTLYAEL